MQRTVDYLIAGGGVAGLSLAYALTQSPLRNRSILIVDREEKGRNDRTLSYWADRPTPFDAIACRTWKRVQITGAEGSRAFDLGPYRYHTIRGADFYAFVLQALRACPNVELVRGTVERIEDGERGATVVIDGTPVAASWVFDSRFRPDDCDPDGTAHTVYQRFKGWEIETAEPAFDPDVPTLFDFRLPQKGEWRFAYVLPYSDRRALVECVTLGRDNFDAILRTYIERTLGISEYRVLAKEAGATPLSDWRFPRCVGPHTMTIGVRGGRVKPSTGYAFTRIVADSEAIVRSLVRHDHPFAVAESGWFARLCDAGTVRLMCARGEWLNPLMAALFARNPAARILRFLDERAAPWEKLAVGATLVPALARQALAPRQPEPRTALRRTTLV